MTKPLALDAAALTDLIVRAFPKFQPIAAMPRDDFYPLARKVLGRNPRTKAEIDEVVRPLVESGLLIVLGNEELARRTPNAGGRSSAPATVTRTYYKLTAAGLAAHREAVATK